MFHKTFKPLIIIGFLIGVFWTITACRNPNSQQVESTSNLTPQSQTAEEKRTTIPISCTPIPQPTGEKVIYPTVEATPSTQLTSGQPLSLTFSGGYVILNNAIVCGDNEFVGYAHSDEIDRNYNWQRQIPVRLNNQILERVDCGYICQIEVTLPQNLAPGNYELTLPFDMSFELEISANSQ